MISTCKETNNTKLCRCMDDTIFKTYTYDEYKSTDKNSTEYKEFLDETKEECLDDSWF
jgi:leucyl aminopeptidase (aminopeptidase T)